MRLHIDGLCGPDGFGSKSLRMTGQAVKTRLSPRLPQAFASIDRANPGPGLTHHPLANTAPAKCRWQAACREIRVSANQPRARDPALWLKEAAAHPAQIVDQDVHVEARVDLPPVPCAGTTLVRIHPGMTRSNVMVRRTSFWCMIGAAKILLVATITPGGVHDPFPRSRASLRADVRA